ncbi:hypothetical protein [uncultured Eudoraea sp.]|uniref:hypothetical protein n=1 Tax=uncultured Eudoraea sp. TaxID=1035614 RepID=UPI0026231D44|nr:hypothetical protein [uncultured Eudoraea sp.]
MNTRVLLTNYEYHYLFNIGGDALVAFFATLRSCKKDIVFKKVGRKGSVSTIRHYTGLSRTTINKHLPALKKLGMVVVQSNGNIAVRSRKWTKKNLPRLKNYKFIPIKIHKKFTDTKWSINYVRIHTNINKQHNAIEKKAERIEQLKHLQKGTIRSYKELKRAKQLARQHSLEGLKKNHRLTSTLSNARFAKLRHPELSRTSGQYGKHKLMKLGYIGQNRKFEILDSNNSKAHWHYWHDIQGIKNCFISKGGIYREVSPDIFLLGETLLGSSPAHTLTPSQTHTTIPKDSIDAYVDSKKKQV